MKQLRAGDYVVREFITHKRQSYPYTYLSNGNAPQVNIALAVRPPDNWSFDPISEPRNLDGSYQRILYASVRNLFADASPLQVPTGGSVTIITHPGQGLPVGVRYWSAGFFGNRWFGSSFFGHPYVANATTGYHGSRWFGTRYFGARYFGSRRFGGTTTIIQQTGDRFYVVNMAQKTYGESIQPGTFRITTGGNTSSLYDDGIGRIYSTDDPTNYIGNVFYQMGIAVVQQATGSVSASVLGPSGMFLDTGSQVDIAFKATHTIYEHRVVCSMDEGENNYSTNPSITRKEANGHRIFDAFASGTLTPYMTTVGCYNDQGELVAVGKFPAPIKRAPETQQTVIIRFDA